MVSQKFTEESLLVNVAVSKATAGSPFHPPSPVLPFYCEDPFVPLNAAGVDVRVPLVLF